MSGKARGKRSGSVIPVKKPRARSKHERLRKMAKYQANRIKRERLNKWNK